MKNSFSLLLLVIFMSLSFLYNAQVYPVSTTIVMPYPHPIFLTDYYEVGGTDLQATINLVDFNVPNHDVRLRVSIENENLKIVTSPNFKPTQPITLTPGIPLTLQGSDFTDYLQMSNIVTEGISISQLNQQSGRLPEGQYNFCIQVIDYNSNKVLSQEMCFSAYLFLEQPPVILEPECESFVNPTNPQNVNFGWQIAGGSSPIVSAMSTFKLFLYQITDPTIDDPKYAVDNSKAILVYESTESSLNTLNLNLNTILLQAGKQYVYRIKAIGPNGKEIFSNDGFSEWCWFFYGFPDDGVLEITEPFDGEIFSKTQQKTFVWGVSNKGVSGQNYSYNIKIVKKDTNQTAEAAMSNNSVYYEERLPQTSSQDGASFLLTQNLDPDTEYAYIIEAFSEGQLVASSGVKTFFSHSLIENFYASNQLIEVTQVYGNDINDLSGKARVAMSDDPSDFVDIEFSHLDLKEVSGLMVLENGTINFDLSDRDELVLSPDIASNGNASFVYYSGIISKNGLLMKGVINWSIPHAVLSDQPSEIVSVESDFVVNSQGQMTGVASIIPFTTTLLSPNGFILELDGTSQLSINENIFQINVKGYITLPESVVNQAGDPIRIEVERHVQQIDYIELDNLIGKLNGGFGLFENLNMEVLPTTGCIFDFSESISPTKLSADPDWKGVYFTDYKVKFKSQNFDASNQLKLTSNRDYDFSTEGTSNKFWIDNNGITFKTNIAVSEDKDLVTFNTFPSPLNFETQVSHFKLSCVFSEF